MQRQSGSETRKFCVKPVVVVPFVFPLEYIIRWAKQKKKRSKIACVVDTRGSFSNDDGNGKKNVTWK